MFGKDSDIRAQARRYGALLTDEDVEVLTKELSKNREAQGQGDGQTQAELSDSQIPSLALSRKSDSLIPPCFSI